MFCANCGCELPSIAKFCVRCGSTISTTISDAVQVKIDRLSDQLPPDRVATDSQAAATAPALAPQARSSPVRGRLLVGASALYLVGVVLLLTAYRLRQEGNWPSAFGFVIGTALIPTLGVFLYYRKKRGASSARIITVLTTWVLFVNVFVVQHNTVRITKDDLPVIAKEAAGLLPISSPNDSGRTAIREYFNDIIDLNKRYEAQVDTIHLDSLYTTKSYLYSDETHAVIDQLNHTLDIESNQETALNQILSRCKTRINELDWPESQKQDFIKSFEEGYAANAVERTAMVTAEKEWLTSVRDLYVFVLENQKYFGSSNGEVVISNETIRYKFNQQIEQANKLKEKFEEASKIYNAKRERYFTQFGMTPEDMGLRKRSND